MTSVVRAAEPGLRDGSTDRRGGLVGLRRVIGQIPVPGTPPRLSRHGAEVGLAFIEASLSLNHVRRLTERVELADHRSARRVTEVEVDLGLLSRPQRDSLSDAVGPSGASGTARIGEQIWVPVAQVSGDNAIPVDVTGPDGERLPRMTQYETSRLMASGLYRLFRAILTGHQDARDPGSDLSSFLYSAHEPRWLVQQALVTLLTERYRPSRAQRWTATPGTEEGVSHAHRRSALGVLDTYERELADYMYLLGRAVDEYMLVVGLDGGRDEHHFSYEAPLLVQDAGRSSGQIWRRAASSRRGYHVRYSSAVPPTLRSYHLVVRAADGLEIRNLMLSTDADREVVDLAGRDLGEVARRLEGARGRERDKPRMKVLELETQDTLRRVAEVYRRRSWNAHHAGAGGVDGVAPATALLSHAVISGEALRGPGDRLDHSILAHPSVTPQALRDAAAEIRAVQFERDLSFDEGPPAGEAHAYWRRPGTRLRSTSQIDVEAAVHIVDATTAGPRTVRSYTYAVSVISYLVACFMARTPFPLWGGGAARLGDVRESADAIVTVLLLLPGFLYSRLPLPSRQSIAGYLQTLPRLVAQGCILVIASLAAAIATESSSVTLQVMFWVTVVAPLVMALLLFGGEGARRGGHRELRRLGAPRWLGDITDTPPGEPDVRFRSASRPDAGGRS